MPSVASPIQFRESVFLFQFRSSNQFRYFQMVCSFSFPVLGLYQHWSFRCLFSWFCQFRFEVRSVSRACCYRWTDYVSQMRVWCFSSTSRAKPKRVGLNFLKRLCPATVQFFWVCFCMTVCLTDMTWSFKHHHVICTQSLAIGVELDLVDFSVALC